jgi:serine/threonine protein kinase
MWAIGIIMHIAITGKHPFQDDSDNYDTFKEKLKKIKHVEPDKSLSALAKNLFGKLTSIKLNQRYYAHEAKKHPWITRKMEEIPMSNSEEVNTQENLRKFKIQMKLFTFFSAF